MPSNMNADELARFTEQFTDPKIDMRDLALIWDKPIGTLSRWGWEMGLKRPKQPGQVRLALSQVQDYCEEVSRELPPYPISALPLLGAGLLDGKRLSLVLYLSDLHGGRLTPSFDASVCAARLELLTDKVLEAVSELRRACCVMSLDIFSLGDLVLGENVGAQFTLEDLEHTILEQVYGLTVPHLCRMSTRLLGSFQEVHMHGVRGNHGRIGPKKGGSGSRAANWDTVAHLAWQAKMSGEQRMTFNIATNTWYTYARTRALSWLLVHGDQFAGGYNGITGKIGRWKATMPHFDLVATGHFHHFAQVGLAYVNGTFVTDDEFCLEQFGRMGDCGQLLLGIGDEGVAFTAPLWLGGLRGGGIFSPPVAGERHEV